MQKVITTIVYTVDELPDSAKQAARDWYREHGFDHSWYDFIYDDFTKIAGILGINIATQHATRLNGKTYDDPQIHFTGFHNQGDGASFAGNYSYGRKASKRIRKHAPKDEELHRIADGLKNAQRRNFHQLHASITCNGRYSHEYTMHVDVQRDSPTNQPIADAADVTLTALFRDLARWLYRQLQTEWEYQTSDDHVDEILLANEYTFTDRGQRFG